MSGSNANTSSLGVGVGVYGSSLGLSGLHSSSASRGGGSLYGTAGSLGAFDTSTSEMLRGVSRAGSGVGVGVGGVGVGSGVYGGSGLGAHAFDAGGGSGEQDLRDRLMKGVGGYGRR